MRFPLLTHGRALNWADVLVLGPYMIYSARGVRHKYFRRGLAAVGIGTILYGLWQLSQPDESTPASSSTSSPSGSASATLEGVRRRLALAQRLQPRRLRR